MTSQCDVSINVYVMVILKLYDISGDGIKVCIMPTHELHDIAEYIVEVCVMPTKIHHNPSMHCRLEDDYIHIALEHDPRHGASPTAPDQGYLAKRAGRPALTQGDPQRSSRPVLAQGSQQKACRDISGRAGLNGHQGQNRVAKPGEEGLQEQGCEEEALRDTQVKRAEWDHKVGPIMPDHFLSKLGFTTLSSLGMNPPGILTCQAARMRLNFSWAKSSPSGSLNAPCDRISSPYGGNSCPD